MDTLSGMLDHSSLRRPALQAVMHILVTHIRPTKITGPNGLVDLVWRQEIRASIGFADENA
jgi:hypothetical protein